MKKALYFSLRRAWNRGLGFRPVAITSEKGGRWFGRDLEHCFPTNGRISELVGRFETEEAVHAKVKGLVELASIYQPRLNELERQRKKANREWADAEREYIEHKEPA